MHALALEEFEELPKFEKIGEELKQGRYRGGFWQQRVSKRRAKKQVQKQVRAREREESIPEEHIEHVMSLPRYRGRTTPERMCFRKKQFATREEAKHAAAEALRVFRIMRYGYQCRICNHWHLTHLKTDWSGR